MASFGDDHPNLNLQNPFGSSLPVTEPARFYGRLSDIRRIYSRIGAERPQSLSLIAEKAMGKSSLLNILAHEGAKAQFLSEPDHYLFALIHLRQREDWTPNLFIPTLIDTLRQKHPDLPKVSDYDELRTLIQRLNSERHSLIAFLDNFEVITQNSDFPPTFFSFLRAMANTYNVSYVTTSSESLQKLCVSKDVEESPFFNIFATMALKPLTDSEIRAWVIEQSNASGVSLSNEADWVYRQAGGFPDLVRALCALLWERKRSQGKLDVDELEAVKAEFQAQIRDVLEAVWQNFSEGEKNLCAHLLSSKETDRPQRPVVRQLAQRGYVREVGEGYALFGGVFEQFVAAKMGVKLRQDQPQKRRWWPF